jgi:hypothetical protein
MGLKSGQNRVNAFFGGLCDYLSVLMWFATILSSMACRLSRARRAGRVASPRRPRFAVRGFGTPVRSEIGPYPSLDITREQTGTGRISETAVLGGQLGDSAP